MFHSTQYVRHHARPLYTPEPDLIHGVIGHGGALASPRFAELNRPAGRAARVLAYDITRYQPILFAADGIEHLLEVVGGFLAECDDDTPARVGKAAPARA